MTTTQLAVVVPAAAVVLVAAINAWWQARVNRQTLESQRKLAVQARVTRTYEDMLELVAWQMEVVNATKPIITKGPSPTPPTGPAQERVRRVQARIGTHGSREVKGVLERWSKTVNEFFLSADYLDAIQRDTSGKDPRDTFGVTLSDQWQKVSGAREELHRIVRELEDAVSAELRS